MAQVGKATIKFEADVSGVSEALTSKMEQALRKIDSALNGVPKTASNAGKQAGTGMASGIQSGAKEADSALKNVGKDGFSGVTDSSKRAADSVASSFSSGAKAADTALNQVDGDGFKGVSNAAKQAGEQVATGLGSGARAGAEATHSAAESASTSFNGIGSAATRAGEQAAAGITSGMRGVSSAAQNASESAASSLGSISGAATRAGEAVTGSFNSLGGAIRNSMSNATAAATSAANSVRNSLTNSFKESENAALRIPSAVSRIGFALAAVAGPAAMVKGGFDRLMNIQRAEIMFKNIGLTADETKTQMAKLSEQVTGTAVSLSDAARYSAAFAQAGVEMGEPMDNAIKAYTNLSAAAAGTGVDVGMVMQQISAAGKLMGGDAMQLQQAGINIYQYVADYMGKSVEEVKKLGEDGKITFEDTINAINQGTGNLAKDMGETLPAKMSNFKTAISNLGAAIVEPFIPGITAAVEFGTALTKNAVQPVKDFFAWIQGGSPAAEVLIHVLEGLAAAFTVFLIPSMVSAASAAVVNAARMVGAWVLARAEAWTNALTHVKSFALIVGGWIRTAAVSAINAAKVAAAWLMAAPGNVAAWMSGVGTMVAQWARLALTSTVEAAKVAAAWVMAAPSKLGAWLADVPRMIAQWVTLGVQSTVNAAKVATAWIIAAPKNAWVGIQALATQAAQWARTAAIATANALRIAAAWLISLGPIGIVIGAIAGVIAVFAALWTRCEGFRNFWVGLWEDVKNIAQGAWNFVTGIFSSETFGTAWTWIKDTATGAWEGIKTAWGEASEFFGNIFNWISGVFDGIAAVFTWLWETILQPMFNGISEAWANISETLAPVIGFLQETFASIGSVLMDLWTNTLQPMFSSIGEAIGTFLSDHWPQIKVALEILGGVLLAPIIIGMGLVVAAIAAVITIVTGVIWAISKFIEILVGMPGYISGAIEALKNWIGQGWQWTKDRFHDMGLAILQFYLEARQWLTNAGLAVLDFYQTHIATLPARIGVAISAVISWFAALPSRIRGALSDAGSWLIDVGRQVVQGMINGIGQMVGNLVGKVRDLAGSAIRAAKGALGIHSPSRVFRSIGENVGEGMVQGLNSQQRSVKNAANTMASAAANLTDLPAPTVGTPDVSNVANAVANVATSSTSTPAPSTASPNGGAPSTDGGDADPAAAEGAWGDMAANMAATADSVIAPMFEAVNSGLGATAGAFTYQSGGVIAPAWSGMAANMAAAKATIIDPMMAGTQQNLTNTANLFPAMANGVVMPAWNGMAGGIMAAKVGTIDPAFGGIQSGMSAVVGSFANGARDIGVHMERLRQNASEPVRFTINRVFNDGVVGMWNSVSDLIGTSKMNPYPVRFATGGLVTGPGGEKDDRVPALLSNREYVMTGEAVRRIGVDNLNALNYGSVRVAPTAFKDKKQQQALLNDATFSAVASRYAGGGIVRGSKAWEQLQRGYLWAQHLSGRPYVLGGDPVGGGGTDCSGYMSSIADRIQGGPGHRQWATMAFNGGGNSQYPSGPQGFVRGLAAGFSIGVHNGGAAGGHTAGTIGGVEGMPAVNVESGGSPSMVKFGTGAVGADHGQFPTKYHLPLGPDGGFVSGGGGSGPSLQEIVAGMIKPFRDKMNAAANQYAARSGMVNTVPRGVAKTMGDAATKMINKKAEESFADPGGAGVERWRPMAMRAMAHVGFDPRNTAAVNAMLKQIATESGGNPGIAQQIVDVNGTGDSAGVGLMQIIPGTFAAYRDPSLPNDRRNPYANMVAALRYYKARYGDDLTTVWGHGHGYHNGGVLGAGQGMFHKTAFEPERVLSPRQTRAFDELVDWAVNAPNPRVSPHRAGTTVDGQGRVSREVHVTQNIYADDAKASADMVEDRLSKLLV